MNGALIAALVEQEVQARTAQVIEECPRDNEPIMDGTGPHLGLRNPWWNDGIHELTDTTWFRWLMVIVVLDHIWSRLK